MCGDLALLKGINRLPARTDFAERNFCHSAPAVCMVAVSASLLPICLTEKSCGVTRSHATTSLKNCNANNVHATTSLFRKVVAWKE